MNCVFARASSITAQYHCSETYKVTTQRGRKFTVSLVALAQGDTISSATVRARLKSSARLDFSQRYQHLSPNCTEIPYNLYSAEKQEQFILYPDGGSCHDTGMARAAINVTFLPCPDAFTLSGDQCVCEERLGSYGAECKISDQKIFITRKVARGRNSLKSRTPHLKS